MPEGDQITSGPLAGVQSLVERAMQAAAAENNSTYQLLLWKCAAEAEYVAFQFSMLHGLGDFGPSSKPGTDAELSVQAAHRFLLDAQSSLQSNPREAYRAIRSAVMILRKMHAAAENISKGGKARPQSNEQKQS